MPSDFTDFIQQSANELIVKATPPPSLNHKEVDVHFEQNQRLDTAAILFASKTSGSVLHRIPLPDSRLEPPGDVQFVKQRREFIIRLAKVSTKGAASPATAPELADSSQRDQLEQRGDPSPSNPSVKDSPAPPSEMPHMFEQLLGCPEDVNDLLHPSPAQNSTAIHSSGEQPGQNEKKKKKKKKKSGAASQPQDGEGTPQTGVEAEEEEDVATTQPATAEQAAPLPAEEGGDNGEAAAEKKKKKKKKKKAATAAGNDINIASDQSETVEVAAPLAAAADVSTAAQDIGGDDEAGNAAADSQHDSWLMEEPDAVSTLGAEVPFNMHHGPRIVSSFSKSEHKGEDKWAQYPSNSWQVLGKEAVASFSAMGMFDGHGGKHAATFASKNLLPNIMGLVDRTRSTQEPGQVEGADPEDQAVWQLQEQLIERLPKAMHEGFLQTDKLARQRFKTSGSTATLAVSVGWELLVASVGDSLAFVDTGAEVVQLTANHRVDDNADERERIVKAGGHIAKAADDERNPVGPLRVWPGGIAFARSIGDHDSGDLLLADAEIRQISLPPTGARLIIASDGLWDHMNPKTLIHQIRKLPAAAAVHTAMHTALKKKGLTDDITVLVVDFLPANVTGNVLPSLAGDLPAHSIEHHNFWKPLEAPSNTWRERLRQHQLAVIALHQAQLAEQEAARAAVLDRQQELERLRAETAALQVQRQSQLSETYRELAGLRVDTSALESLPVDDGEWQTVKAKQPSGGSFMDQLIAAAHPEDIPDGELADASAGAKQRRPRGGRREREKQERRAARDAQQPHEAQAGLDSGTGPAAEAQSAEQVPQGEGRGRPRRSHDGGRGPRGERRKPGQQQGASVEGGAAQAEGAQDTAAPQVPMKEGGPERPGRQPSFKEPRGPRRPPRDYPPRPEHPSGDAASHADALPRSDQPPRTDRPPRADRPPRDFPPHTGHAAGEALPRADRPRDYPRRDDRRAQGDGAPRPDRRDSRGERPPRDGPRPSRASRSGEGAANQGAVGGGQEAPGAAVQQPSEPAFITMPMSAIASYPVGSRGPGPRGPRQENGGRDRGQPYDGQQQLSEGGQGQQEQRGGRRGGRGGRGHAANAPGGSAPIAAGFGTGFGPGQPEQ